MDPLRTQSNVNISLSFDLHQGQKAGDSAEKVTSDQSGTRTDKTDDLSDQCDTSDDSNW